MSEQSARILLETEALLARRHGVTPATASAPQLHDCLSEAVLTELAPRWNDCRAAHAAGRRVYYLSAEYLTGRLVYQNLFNAGLLTELTDLFAAQGADLAVLEDIEAASLGNGGLGRLAACYLDSAAALSVPLDGYGLRYRFGLFRQRIVDGAQVEEAEDWLADGDPWSQRRYGEAVLVSFPDQTVRAVPYDMPVIGCGSGHIGTLRLWQCEPLREFDFAAFDRQDFTAAMWEKNQAENITRVLYPNDSSWEGKRLRLKQQYFLCSASLQDVLAGLRRAGQPLAALPERVALQLNDTHPALAIPELCRLLMEAGLDFDGAFDLARGCFHYTNHTVMGEALERWELGLMRSVCPAAAELICRIDGKLRQELAARGASPAGREILEGETVHMARLAVYAAGRVNGVAEIHSQLLKTELFRDFYQLWPEKFTNVTNGVSQRRWLGLCNPELCGLLDETIGPGYLTDLDRLAALRPHIGPPLAERFLQVKQEKKRQLSDWVRRKTGAELPPDFLFDVQIKRIHEYKRQLLNGLLIAELYYALRDGELEDLPPTAFVFGGKAASGYRRAKSVIRYLNRLADRLNGDPAVSGRLRVLFVPDYNCSAAEKLIPAAELSEQISPAGTEASGTGNMKLMLNGALTLGTPDGANLEIARAAGYENNYIFGATVAELRAARPDYRPRERYEGDYRIRRAVDTLVNGFVETDDGLRELYDALLTGVDWGPPDVYALLLDFPAYREAKLRALRDLRDRTAYGEKALRNIAAAGVFSSDRSIRQYAAEIWRVT